MSRQQIIFSIILTIASLIIGYLLSFYASKKANEVLLGNLREEADIIDKNYKTLLDNPNLDADTRKYLEARNEYLKNKIGNVSQMVKTY